MVVEERIVAVLMCVMVLMVVGQVLSRYVLHVSLSHTEELVRYCFVWATFLGASAAVHRGKHLSIAGAFTFLPRRIVRYIRLLAGAGGVLFFAVLLVYGVRIVALQIRTGQTTAAMGLPMWIFGLAVPVCALFVIYRIVQSAVSADDRPDADDASMLSVNSQRDG